MAVPLLAAALGKGAVLLKGVNALKVAKIAGAAVVPAATLVNNFSKKEKKDIQKSGKKNGIKIDFDIDGKFKIHNKQSNSCYAKSRYVSKHYKSKNRRYKVKGGRR